jgi:DNA repair exonuclease SbcCD ATPase subunit
MKIVSLEAENVKCLKAIEIKPDGNLVIIGGNNGAGKSSILDSIEYALAGSKHIPDRPIREGQEKARIILDLGDIQVIRTFTKNGTNLVVKSKDGATFATPQDMLNKIVGNLSFDPSEFFRMDDKKRIETLKKLVGLDFTELTKNYKDAFDTRTDINRRGKELKAQYDSLSYCNDVPDKEVSVAELSKQLTDALMQNKRLDDLKRSLDNNELKITRVNEQIIQLMEEKAKIENFITSEKANIKKLKPIDVSEIQSRISSAEEVNKTIRANDAKKALETALQELRGKSEAISITLKGIDETKQQMMEKAKFPIKGLAFDEETVTFNGIPFDQISQGERIKISVAIGLVLNPKLKILLIRDASLLDEKNLEMVAKMAQKMDAQVWLERVGKGKECQIIISDGSIADKND